MIWIIPAIFVLVQSPSGDSAYKFDGVPKESVEASLVLQGLSYRFITEAEYKAFVVEKRPVPTELPKNVAAKAIIGNQLLPIAQRFQALLTLMDLD